MNVERCEAKVCESAEKTLETLKNQDSLKTHIDRAINAIGSMIQADFLYQKGDLVTDRDFNIKIVGKNNASMQEIDNPYVFYSPASSYTDINDPETKEISISSISNSDNVQEVILNETDYIFTITLTDSYSYLFAKKAYIGDKKVTNIIFNKISETIFKVILFYLDENNEEVSTILANTSYDLRILYK